MQRPSAEGMTRRPRGRWRKSPGTRGSPSNSAQGVRARVGPSTKRPFSSSLPPLGLIHISNQSAATAVTRALCRGPAVTVVDAIRWTGGRLAGFPVPAAHAGGLTRTWRMDGNWKGAGKFDDANHGAGRAHFAHLWHSDASAKVMPVELPESLSTSVWKSSWCGSEICEQIGGLSAGANGSSRCKTTAIRGRC